jgi:cold shock CspA family protein
MTEAFMTIETVTAIITFESGKGYYFAETETNLSVFIHQNFVNNQRALHIGDRVRFTLAPNPKKAGGVHGVDVEYLGHVTARQTSGAQGGSHE